MKKNDLLQTRRNNKVILKYRGTNIIQQIDINRDLNMICSEIDSLELYFGKGSGIPNNNISQIIRDLTEDLLLQPIINLLKIYEKQSLNLFQKLRKNRMKANNKNENYIFAHNYFRLENLLLKIDYLSKIVKPNNKLIKLKINILNKKEQILCNKIFKTNKNFNYTFQVCPRFTLNDIKILLSKENNDKIEFIYYQIYLENKLITKKFDNKYIYLIGLIKNKRKLELKLKFKISYYNIFFNKF